MPSIVHFARKNEHGTGAVGMGWMSTSVRSRAMVRVMAIRSGLLALLMASPCPAPGQQPILTAGVLDTIPGSRCIALFSPPADWYILDNLDGFVAADSWGRLKLHYR